MGIKEEELAKQLKEARKARLKREGIAKLKAQIRAEKAKSPSQLSILARKFGKGAINALDKATKPKKGMKKPKSKFKIPDLDKII